MARTKNTTPDLVGAELALEAVQSATVALNEVSAAEMGAVGASELYMGVGRIQALEFQRSVSDVAIAQTFIGLKKSNEFKNLLVRTPAGDLKRVSDLEEFCLLFFRKSYRRMNQLESNYEILGPDLYEQAQLIGFSARDYSSLKALPADMQDQVKAVITQGSKDAAVELMCELAARAAAMKARLDETDKVMAAKDRVIAKKDAKLNQWSEAEEIRRDGTPDEREKQQIADLRGAGIAAELALQRLVTCVAEVMNAPATEAAELQARQTIDFIAQRLADLCAAAHIAVDVLGERVEPGWRRQITDLVAAAAQAANEIRGGRA